MDVLRDLYEKYQHIYLSAACYHDDHHLCQNRCPHCPSTCICECHKETDESRKALQGR